MFKVTQKGMNRLDIELSGKLNSEEMKIALDELVSKSKEIEKGRMLYDIIDFPSLGAIAIEFSRLLKTDLSGKNHNPPKILIPKVNYPCLTYCRNH